MGKSVKSISGAASGLAKNPLDPKAYANFGIATTTGGLTDLNGVGNLILGKKKDATPDGYAPLHASQEMALNKYTGMLNQNTDGMAEEQAVRQENQIRTNAEDSQRQAKSLIAQRGLGNSSVGLNAILNTTRNMNDQIGGIRAGLNTSKYDMMTKNLNNASTGIGNILNSRDKTFGDPGGRQGGLAPLLGAGLGAYMGGAAGAKMGYGMGGALTQV